MSGGDPLYSPRVIYAAIYVSRSVKPISEMDLAEILFSSRRRNAANGITGRLVYSAPEGEPGMFAQWIEGEDWRVRELLYRSILRDGRHALIGRPFEGPVSRRQFPTWTMGYERLENESAVSQEIERLVSLAHAIQPRRRSNGTTPDPRQILNA